MKHLGLDKKILIKSLRNYHFHIKLCRADTFDAKPVSTSLTSHIKLTKYMYASMKDSTEGIICTSNNLYIGNPIVIVNMCL